MFIEWIVPQIMGAGVSRRGRAGDCHETFAVHPWSFRGHDLDRTTRGGELVRPLQYGRRYLELRVHNDRSLHLLVSLQLAAIASGASLR